MALIVRVGSCRFVDRPPYDSKGALTCFTSYRTSQSDVILHPLEGMNVYETISRSAEINSGTW